MWRHDFFVLRDVHSQHVIFKLTGRFASRKHSEFVLIIFYLQLIKSGHADSSIADKKKTTVSFPLEDKHALMSA